MKQKINNHLLSAYVSLVFIVFTVILYYGCCKSINEILNLKDFFCLQNKEISLIMVLGTITLTGISINYVFGCKTFIQYFLSLSAILAFIGFGLLMESLNCHHNMAMLTDFVSRKESSGLILDPEEYWNIFGNLIMTGKDLGFSCGLFYEFPLWLTYWGSFFILSLVTCRVINYISYYTKVVFKKGDYDWPLFNSFNLFLLEYSKLLKTELVTLIFSFMLAMDILALLPHLSVLSNLSFFYKEIDFLFFFFLGVKLYILKSRTKSKWKKYTLLIVGSIIFMVLDFIIPRCWVLMSSYLTLVEKGTIIVTSDTLTIMHTGPMGLISMSIFLIMKACSLILH